METLLEGLEWRIAQYRWERSLAEDRRRAVGGGRARRFLDDVERAAGAELAHLLTGALPALESIREVLEPPLAEMLALTGDLELVAGRFTAAAEAYRLAESLAPAYEPLCGRLHDGKLYGIESFVDSEPGFGDRRWIQLTPYFLARDLESHRVLERHLLPELPEAVAAEGETLRISLVGGRVVRLVGSRLEPPAPVSKRLFNRLTALSSGRRLAQNFVGHGSAARAPFAVGRRIDDRLPLTLTELEEALRAAAALDPTQPWHPFFLGQALWAQGRRPEAEAHWHRLWRDGARTVPFNELAWMAASHEVYGQPAWADRLFALALEQRRRLPRAIIATRSIERALDFAAHSLSTGLRHDSERRLLWWRRTRQISGIAPGDAFRAALWVHHLEQRGDRQRARQERAYLERARQAVFDPALATAWLDYSLYLAAAVAAALFARFAALAGRLARRPGRLYLELPIFAAALYLTLSLPIFAASYFGYLVSLQPELGEIPATSNGWRASPEDLGLRPADLLRAWLTRGIVETETGSLSPLVTAARDLRGGGLGRQLAVIAAAAAAIALVALPAGLLLRRRRIQDAASHWIPGVLQSRTGTAGALVFGLWIFALAPLVWLAAARAWGALPAPGPVSASFFFAGGLEEPFLPPPPGPEDTRSELERLRAASFWRLLKVYPGAGLFWASVGCALVLASSVHLLGLTLSLRALPSLTCRVMFRSNKL